MSNQAISLLVIGMKDHADSVVFEALRQRGYRLRCLADVQEAPKAIQEEDYGLVI